MLQEQVLNFLREFKAAMSISSRILFAARKENEETILDLELSQKKVENILASLQLIDYSQGPIPNDQYGNMPMWVFGKNIKGKEVYIKITCANNGPFCISFHYSRFRMKYPFKNT
ncbi:MULTISPECIES: type II toxin-antitoxin system MqsR family toxin [unclassified Flavobacterium]|uniref:type II toxin-antitoxin system MqsR family toxin n=1 Tax=unclassified Flavobacterium TaxID=196869 RepID=UPI001F13F7AD|nr:MULTISPECIES: type II toxin-antitoxin system MqsR family toxin [unclassified Flavobacterium]UMY65316.1 type II toxin-antitoxin system MqsR family toxin [Flavobacterium sp. HJ-32-4]